jgi:hypothetical protein
VRLSDEALLTPGGLLVGVVGEPPAALNLGTRGGPALIAIVWTPWHRSCL